MHILPTKLPWILLAISTAAGCSDGPTTDSYDADFQDLSNAQLTRIAHLASGNFHRAAANLSLQLKAQDANCPSLSARGAEQTLTGGCTDSAGNAMSGSIQLLNAPEDVSSPRPNMADESVYEYRDFALTSNTRLNLDGTIRMSPPAQGAIKTTLDFVFTVSGTDVNNSQVATSTTLQGEQSCLVDDASNCTFAKGSWGEILELGAFSIEGNTHGVVVLQGRDTMKLHYSLDADGCMAIEIGEHTTMLCGD